MNYFNNKLLNLIKDTGYSLEKLSMDINEKTGGNISKSMLSKWRSGNENPSLINVRILATYFQVSIDELLGVVPKNNGNNVVDELDKLYNKYLKLNSNNKKEVNDYIDFKLLSQEE